MVVGISKAAGGRGIFVVVTGSILSFSSAIFPVQTEILMRGKWKSQSVRSKV